MLEFSIQAPCKKIAFFLFSIIEVMSFKFLSISKSVFIHHRPLTQLALDNKIRAIISQFHPYERQFIRITHENSECLPNSSILTNEKSNLSLLSLKSDSNCQMICNSKKVAQWLEDVDDNYNGK